LVAVTSGGLGLLLVNPSVILILSGPINCAHGSLEAEDLLASLDGTFSIEESAVNVINLEILHLTPYL
jgi:hypothetical protein